MKVLRDESQLGSPHTAATSPSPGQKWRKTNIALTSALLKGKLVVVYVLLFNIPQHVVHPEIIVPTHYLLKSYLQLLLIIGNMIIPTIVTLAAGG